MDSETKLEQLKTLIHEYYDLYRTIGLLEWDQQTYMPAGGSEGRSQQLGTLYKVAHQKITAPEIGELLDGLERHAQGLDPDSDDARFLKVTARRYNRKVRVPAVWVEEFGRVTGAAFKVWESARAGSDYSAFKPHLQRIIELRREFSGFFQPYDHIYDPLLEEFEPGMKTAEVQAIFSWLRPRQVELIRAITERPQVDDSFLNQPFDEQAQWEFGVEVITRFGYDWQHGRQDRAAHPFTQTVGYRDVRITTRFLPNYLPSALFSTTHECGHALYEMGIDPGLARTTLDRGTSMAVHESQSRFYENFLSRSRAFWVYFYPRLQAYFPSQLAGVPLPDFYRGINKVVPSLIRVEADEATYNLHIMLRLELEINLIDGRLSVDDLPEAWNQSMQSFLGITPPNDARGVLQDIHWSSGYFGYFPTYALGNLIAAQLWEQINQEIPGIEEEIRCGQFGGISAWMKEKIHRHGSKFEPQELVQRVTGRGIDPAPYLRYLSAKYGEIYGLSL